MIKTLRGMCRFTQVDNITNKRLKSHLYKYSYFPYPYNPNLFTHWALDTIIKLIVGNFRVKYISNANDMLFLRYLQSLHTINKG